MKLWERMLKAAAQAAPAVPTARRQFFASHVVSQIGVNLHSNRMLLHIAEAVSGEASLRRRHLDLAASEIREVQAALKHAEYGKWTGFYKGELFVDLKYTAELVRAAVSKVEIGQPPADVKLAIHPPDPYHALKAYQEPRRVLVQ